MALMAGGAMSVMGAGLGAAPGGGATPDFSASGQEMLAVPMAVIDTIIVNLQADVGGDSVAQAIIDLGPVFDYLYAQKLSVDAINLSYPDSYLDALSTGLQAGSDAFDAVYTNLSADSGGDSVAQAITDMQAAEAALSAL